MNHFIYVFTFVKFLLLTIGIFLSFIEFKRIIDNRNFLAYCIKEKMQNIDIM